MLTTEDFDFDLPEELIAQTPLKDRASSRLLVVNKETGDMEDKPVSYTHLTLPTILLV